MIHERIEFENWLGIKPCGAAHDLAWAAWQARASLPAPQQATPEPVGEPFGYFRALPFGLEQCGEHDDGAVALYTRPAPGVPEDVLAILDECRNALMECDRDGDYYALIDYALIDRIDALAAAQAKGGV